MKLYRAVVVESGGISFMDNVTIDDILENMGKEDKNGKLIIGVNLKPIGDKDMSADLIGEDEKVLEKYLLKRVELKDTDEE